MEKQEMQSEQMGPRSAEHDKLNPFEGTFSAVVKLWMGAGEPMLSTGTMVNKWVLGGRYLQQTYAGDPVDGSHDAFAGTGFWGYDATLAVYQGFWVDNASSAMQMETGTVDKTGRVWTMQGSMLKPQTREPLTKRTVITLQDHDHQLVESFFAYGGGDEIKAIEIRYTRAK